MQSMPGPWWFCSVVSVVLGIMMSGKYRFENCKQCGSNHRFTKLLAARSMLKILPPVLKKMRYVGRLRCRAILGKKFKLLEAWSVAG